MGYLGSSTIQHPTCASYQHRPYCSPNLLTYDSFLSPKNSQLTCTYSQLFICLQLGYQCINCSQLYLAMQYRCRLFIDAVLGLTMLNGNMPISLSDCLLSLARNCFQSLTHSLTHKHKQINSYHPHHSTHIHTHSEYEVNVFFCVHSGSVKSYLQEYNGPYAELSGW